MLYNVSHPLHSSLFSLEGNNEYTDKNNNNNNDKIDTINNTELMFQVPVNQNNNNNMNNNITSLMGDEYDGDEYSYIYNYGESVNSVPPDLIPVAIIYGLTLVLGILGNGLVIFAIARNKRMQTVTNSFLVSLSSADLLLVVLCVPIKFAKFMTFTWSFGEALCKVVHYMQNVSVICSVLTLTVMSAERYYAILHPMRARFVCTRARARRAILGVWFASFILATPILIGQIHKEVGVRRTGYWCVKEWDLPAYSKTYEVAMLLIVLTIPIIIISFAYINICKELWHMESRRNTLRAEKNHSTHVTWTKSTGYRQPGAKTKTIKRVGVDENNTRKQVIKMLVLVIVLFAICWGPLLIDNVLAAFDVVHSLHYGNLKYMRQAFSLMAYANSCVNPIVYAFMSRNFRDSFVHSLCSCVKGEAYRRRRTFLRQVSTGVDSRMTSVTYNCRNSTSTILQHGGGQEAYGGPAGIELTPSPCRTRLISTEALITTDNDAALSDECNL